MFPFDDVVMSPSELLYTPGYIPSVCILPSCQQAQVVIENRYTDHDLVDKSGLQLEFLGVVVTKPISSVPLFS